MNQCPTLQDLLTALRAQDADLYQVVLLCPASVREALATLFLWDATLTTAAYASPEPMVNLIRLAWWREQLEALGTAAPDAALPAPLLTQMRTYLLPLGINPARLAALEAPWATLLEEDAPHTAQSLTGWCCQRGGALFDLAVDILAPQADAEMRKALHQCGHLWAFSQWVRAHGLHMAAPARPARTPLPAALRPLAALAQLADRDVRRATRAPTKRPQRKGSPLRMLSLIFESLRAS